VVALRVSSCNDVFERENMGSKRERERERERERCGERAHTQELNEEQMSPFLKALEKFGEEDEHNNRESHLSTQHIHNAFKRTEEVRAEANDPPPEKGLALYRVYSMLQATLEKSGETPVKPTEKALPLCRLHSTHTTLAEKLGALPSSLVPRNSRFSRSLFPTKSQFQ
jgi:hypothetical protein